jgi:hypothetical protein
LLHVFVAAVSGGGGGGGGVVIAAVATAIALVLFSKNLKIFIKL